MTGPGPAERRLRRLLDATHGHGLDLVVATDIELVLERLEDARDAARTSVAAPPIRDLPDFEIRMAAARARAHYELGDPTLAEIILAAFMDPDVDTAALRAEQGEPA